MPFLGRQPAVGFASIAKDDFTADGSTTAFTLSRVASNANDIAVFVGNVRQEPTDAYSVSGTTLTMTAAPSSGTNFYVLHLAGGIASSTVPAAGTTVPGNFSASGTLSSTGDLSTTEGNIFLPAGSYIRGSARVSDGETVGTPSGRILGTSATSTNLYGEDYIRIGIGSGGGEVGRWTSSGLSFDSGSNHLNDYEEGTWTPVIGGTGGDPTVSYDYQIGWYIRIGDMVNFGGRIQWNSSGSSGGGGDATLKTLPFTAGGPGSVSTGCGFVKMSFIHFDGNFSAGRDFVDLNVNSNTNYISFYQMDYDNPDYPIYTGLGLSQTIAGDGRIDFSGHYTVT